MTKLDALCVAAQKIFYSFVLSLYILECRVAIEDAINETYLIHLILSMNGVLK